MPLFHRESPEERQRREGAEAAAREEASIQERSRQSLQAGGLPVRAQERVAQIRAAGGKVPLFSSNLSVDELSLARQSGYAPLGLVSGSSVYHIGWNRWTQTGELSAQTGALGSAVYAAIDRLRQEAHGMGALGVVGVELQIGIPGWGEHLIEVILTGTAITAPGGAPPAQPFVSGISMQEYWTLLRSGVRPSGLVFGNSSYYIYSNWQARRQTYSWYNQEMELYANSLRYAQGLAFGRMHQAAAQTGATGVIGVHVEHHVRPIEYEVNDTTYIDYVVEYRSWGTAIVEAPGHSQIAPPSMVVDLRDAKP